MSDTAEILKAHAPQFVALDEAERKATPAPWRLVESGWEYAGKPAHYLSPQVGRDGVFRQHDTTFVYEARWSSRDLLDFCAQLLVEKEWRTIDSAPRDGTVFDVWANVGGLEYGRNGRLTNCYYKNGRLWKVDDSESESDYRLDSLAVTPTHWQPLPKPPGEVATPNASTNAETEPKTPLEPATPDSQITAESSQITTLQEKLEKAKEALRFYAEERNYHRKTGVNEYGPFAETRILEDGGDEARAALAELEGV